MRRDILIPLSLSCAVLVGACENSTDAEVERAMQAVNAIDETNLNDVMLTVGDPNEAIAYFAKSSAQEPDRIDFRRGLAQSLVRAQRIPEAVSAWRSVVEHEESTNADQVDLADALIRDMKWKDAEGVLDSVPPTFETYKRYRLEAMIADSNKEWTKADSFYETAAGMTIEPAGVLNNWGYSKLSRGDYGAAENLFRSALRSDPSLFTAKNNLVLARAAKRDYQLPLVPMTQIERAQLLHTMALSAIKQGDVTIGKGLLQEAIDTHPQHFEVAVRSLRALENNVTNG